MEEKNIVLEVLSKTDKVFEGIKFLITFLHNNIDIMRGTNRSFLHYFMLNVRNIPKTQNTNLIWNNITKKGDTKNAIITAFDWDLSPEGYDFWDAIDTQFRQSYANAIHNGLDYKEVLENDEIMKKFAEEYITPYLPKDKIEQRDTKYFPPTMPIMFTDEVKDDVEVINGIVNNKRDPSSIKVVPSGLTDKLMRFLSPTCTHENKQIDIFNKVLEENNCKNEYYKNLRTKPKYRGYEVQFKEYLANKDLKGIVYWSFNWITSKEGISFWSDIASKVEAALKKEFANGYGINHNMSLHPMSQQRGLIYNPYAYGYSSYREDPRPPYTNSYYERPSYVSLPKDIIDMPICNNFIEIVEKKVTVPSI